MARPPHPFAPARRPARDHLDTALAVATGLAARPELWEASLEHVEDQRIHLRLAATDDWEAWLITWPSGHGVEMHDHGESSGAVAVVTGGLVELVARRESGRLSGGVARRALPAGTVRRVPPDRVHDVVNLDRDAAVSIHVYSPPLATMTFYDDGLRPTRTETIFPEAPVLDRTAVDAAMAAPA